MRQSPSTGRGAQSHSTLTRFRSHTTGRFRDGYAALPVTVQRQARVAYRLFKLDPSHPGLHFKKIHPKRPIYSARVGIGYRALAVLEGKHAIWFWIGTHADYDRMVAKL
jgi:hypothetical protein